MLLVGCAIEQQPIDPLLTRALSGPPTLEVREVFLDQRIASMTVEQKVAALVMVHVPGTSAKPIRQFTERWGFGGVIIMGDNVGGSAARVAELTSAISTDAALPLLTAIDQEGGIVRRLPGDDAPAARALWDAPPSATESAFRERSELVADAGVLINFGIVADVTPDASSFIVSRTLGAEPDAAADRVAAAVRGEQGTVLSTLKHFPGHGASPDDSHVSIPRSSLTLSEWRDSHALPFIAGIEAGAPLVMLGHLRFDEVSELPASLSAEWVRILRDELEFDGIIVTDDLLMLQRSGESQFDDPVRNARRALAAGNDLLLFVLPGDPSTVGVDPERLIASLATAVREGDIDAEALDESLERVLRVRSEASDVLAPFVDCGLKCWGESPRSEPRSDLTE